MLVCTFGVLLPDPVLGLHGDQVHSYHVHGGLLRTGVHATPTWRLINIQVNCYTNNGDHSAATRS